MSTIATIRPQVGLMLSIGLPPNSEGNPGNHPKKLNHFRAKPGALLQYLSAAERFADAYGPEPTQVDVLFVSDDVGLNLDIRPKVFRQSGLKALGTRNLAELPPDEFAEALYGYTETLDVYPDDDSPMIQYELQGPTDKLVRREVPGRGGKTKVVQDCKVYGVLRFSIPEVTGLMTLVEISTTSRRSMKNLYAGIHMARQITGGTLTGIPLVLSVRPTAGRYFDAEAGKKKSTTFYELALDTRDTYREVWELAMERRAITAGQPLALDPIDHLSLERDAELVPEHRALAPPPTVNIEAFEEDSLGEPETDAEASSPSAGSSPVVAHDEAPSPGDTPMFEIPESVEFAPDLPFVDKG